MVVAAAVVVVVVRSGRPSTPSTKGKRLGQHACIGRVSRGSVGGRHACVGRV